MGQHVFVLKTGDGTHTLYSEKFADSYHSIHGAVQESRHVYIQNGLTYARTLFQSICILELGFGTGLNALLSVENCMDDPELDVDYIAYEAYPLSLLQIEETQYQALVDEGIFWNLHTLPWNQRVTLAPKFTLTKRHEYFQNIDEAAKFNLVYYDAFAPTKQPELWDLDFVHKIAHAMQPQGILVTYCSQGKFRRALDSSGFEVEKLAGPPGKREMVRAIKM